ncbi:MAG: hypothetical protein WBA10_07880 [Elainellaceae cyanobacterium]
MKESSDFLSLFPHRYDFLHAEHPAPNRRPAWKTEHRYPLSDRLIQQGDRLFGVRFGPTTCYALLDIDSGSHYHPQHDSQGINQILGALEPLGLVSYIACTSSYSGGLHLYFPFEEIQSSQRLAQAMKGCLQQAGLTLVAGQLELFPNPRLYSGDFQVSTTPLFNGHRLPLQTGSYLLNDGFHPIWTSPEQFVDQWQQCRAQNDVTAAGLRQILKRQRRQYIVSGKANKFLNDLNADIEPGWTGPSQTNHLLGRIALRSYVFGHVLSSGEPLSGQALTDAIVAIAKALPGYEEWCQHRHEIEQRAEEWTRCVEASKYYPYGFNQKSVEPEVIRRDWNQEQFAKTSAKIQAAVVDLIRVGLPGTATARFKALLAYGIGGGSLYRHKKLWHPDYLSTSAECGVSGEIEEYQTTSNFEPGVEASLDSASTAPTPPSSTTSFFSSVGGNPFPGLRSSHKILSSPGGNLWLVWRLSLVLSVLYLEHQCPPREQFLTLWRSRQRMSTG